MMRDSGTAIVRHDAEDVLFCARAYSAKSTSGAKMSVMLRLFAAMSPE